MDMIIELINSLGFPIAMVCYFIWHENKSTSGLIESLNNNTLVLNKLLVKLDHEEILEEVVDNE